MGTSSENENHDRKKKIITIILLLFLFITIGITIWAIWFRDTTPALAPDYAPQETEKNAEPFDDDADGEKLEQQEGGGAVSLTYSREITIDLSDKQAKMMFANPQKSNQNIMIQIVVQDIVIAQSGLLEPGYQVKNLDLFDTAELSEGTYEGKYIILYYQQDSGEKAMLNTEIPLEITVTE